MKKNITKKTAAITLVIAMAIGAVGCGSKTEDKKQQTTMAEQTTESAVQFDLLNSSDKTEDVETGIMYDEACDATDEKRVAPDIDYGPDFNTNEYDSFRENSWTSVKNQPLSTFAADVDTAAYSQIRSNILNGYKVEPSQVRIEEMINYFKYDYKRPKGDDKFGVYTEYADCPWSDDTKLALVSLSTEEIDFSDAPASNIVFLIDVSGSMFDDNKLPLVQQSLCMLAENLTAKDRISIVTYAGDDKVVLEGAKGSEYHEISSAIEGLEAHGSTNGSAGINTAYEIAEKYFIEGGNNRVILATDGDLNVGVTSEGELDRLITEKKETGVFLSVIGVGYGNYKDNKLETLADRGNGNYAYIDSIFEAKKALVDNLGATMVTVAKDVKLQVEFNPENVKGYRLIGYENRVMAAEDFADDTKDGGEMGAGHTVTALYEIALSDSAKEIGDVELKYGNDSDEERIYDGKSYSDEIFTLSVRYKEPDKDKSKLNTYVCDKECYTGNGSDNLRWAAAVAGFGLILKESEYVGDCTTDMVIELARSCNYRKDDYKKEFIGLVEYYESAIY